MNANIKEDIKFKSIKDEIEYEKEKKKEEFDDILERNKEITTCIQDRIQIKYRKKLKEILINNDKLFSASSLIRFIKIEKKEKSYILHLYNYFSFFKKYKIKVRICFKPNKKELKLIFSNWNVDMEFIHSFLFGYDYTYTKNIKYSHITNYILN